MTTPRAMTPEEHRRSTIVARCIYGLIIVSFITVCTVAVTVSSQMERTKPGFKAITVTKPISIFDTTYLKPPEQKPAVQALSTTAGSVPATKRNP
jgi:hypothetical protein